MEIKLNLGVSETNVIYSFILEAIALVSVLFMAETIVRRYLYANFLHKGWIKVTGRFGMHWIRGLFALIASVVISALVLYAELGIDARFESVATEKEGFQYHGLGIFGVTGENSTQWSADGAPIRDIVATRTQCMEDKGDRIITYARARFGSASQKKIVCLDGKEASPRLVSSEIGKEQYRFELESAQNQTASDWQPGYMGRNVSFRIRDAVYLRNEIQSANITVTARQRPSRSPPGPRLNASATVITVKPPWDRFEGRYVPFRSLWIVLNFNETVYLCRSYMPRLDYDQLVDQDEPPRLNVADYAVGKFSFFRFSLVGGLNNSVFLRQSLESLTSADTPGYLSPDTVVLFMGIFPRMRMRSSWYDVAFRAAEQGDGLSASLLDQVKSIVFLLSQ